MNNLWQATFTGLSGLFTPGQGCGDAIGGAIDQLVERTDSRLRALNYCRALRPPMQRAHDYVSDLVAQIPGPTLVCADTFSRDPMVNAFFATIDDLHRVFSSSDPLRSFFATPDHVDCSDCLALLCMRRHEKKVFGMQMDGDELRRDVAQTLISFDDHQVLTPTEQEDELREGLHRCMLDGLMNHARDGLVNDQQQYRQLQDRRRMLSSRLRAQQRGADPAAKDSGSIDDTRSQLDAVDQQLTHLHGHIGSLEQQLSLLAQKLDQARDHVHMKHHKLRLTKTHVKLDAERDRHGALLNLTEVRLGHEPPRVVTLARYPRGEVLSHNGAFFG